ncbi:NAD+ synthase [Thiohalospira sp.]|uniref:NAD+ synthase n=1 Tax=Thiohalospira sp. TaxID=3080549 RepID=UPI003980770A
MSDGLTVAIAQLDPLVGDVAGNAEAVIAAATRAQEELDADLLLCPELVLSGYPPDDLLLHPELERQCRAAVERIAAAAGIDIVLGTPWRDERGLHNAALHLRDGGVAARYAKRELPNYSVFDEKRYFRPGEAPCVVEVAGCRLGLVVCEDVWVPGPVESAAEAGAEAVLVLNASPFHAERGAEREASVGERAAIAGVPLLYANLVGGQDELVFDGASFAVDGAGRVTQRAPAFEGGLHPVRLERTDKGLQPKPGPASAPATGESALYHALVLGVSDYIAKNGFPGAVVGLSGGIDSALTLAVAVDALGPERVTAVMMPSPYTRPMSLEDAAAEAESLGVEYHTLPIEGIQGAFLETLAGPFAGTEPGVTEENIQARIRGTLLMALSNKTGRMVLTTGNKSEMAVGYATLYGDMAGGLAVLKDVPKTTVYALAEYRNGKGRVIPRRVLERPPSAELAPDQEDSDSLPPYPELDAILALYVEADEPVATIIERGYDAATVHRVARLVDRNEYKRRQAPPGIRVSRRAFGRDRRYPITSGFRHDAPEA